MSDKLALMESDAAGQDGNMSVPSKMYEINLNAHLADKNICVCSCVD